MAVRIDGKDLKRFDVTDPEGKFHDYQFRQSLRGGRQAAVGRVLERLLRAQRPRSQAARPQPDRRIDRGRRAARIAPAIRCPSRTGGSSSRLPRPRPTSPGRRAAILEKFASRAYRRPVTAAELAKLVKLVELAIAQGDRFERGIQLAVQAVLDLARVPLSRRARLAGQAHHRQDRSTTSRSSGSAISSWRAGCRISSGAACPTTSSGAAAVDGSLRNERRPRETSAPHAPRPQGPGPGRQLRRPVAPVPQPQGVQSRSRPVSPASTTSSATR